jgi:hypothetical protein
MAAATYADIVAACPGATPEFICEELKAGASVEQAAKDFVAHLQLQLENSRQGTEKAVADAAAQAKADAAAEIARIKAAGTGIDPLKEGSGAKKTASGEAGSAREEFEAAIAAKVERGMKRQQAVSAVVRERPDLQQAVIAEAKENVKRRAS